MILLIINALIIRTKYKFTTNAKKTIIPQSFQFKKEGLCTIQIKSEKVDSIYVYIDREENILKNKKEIKNQCNNMITAKNGHFIQLQNGTGTYTKIVQKDGVYKVFCESCQGTNENFTIDISYSEKNSSSKITSNVNFRLIISIACIIFVIYLFWLINWFMYFSMKNIIHLILTISLTFFLVEKIICIFHFKANYQSKNCSMFAIFRNIFVFLSNFLFFFSILLIIAGYSINYENPKLYNLFICLFMSALITSCFLYNNIYFSVPVFFVYFIICTILLYIHKDDSKCDEAGLCQLISFIALFIFSFVSFLTFFKGYSTKYEKISVKQLKTTLIMNIVNFLPMIIILVNLRMKNETMKDYRHFYFYSIYNVDTNDSSMEIRYNAFSNSSLTKFTILKNVVSIGNAAFRFSRKLKEINFEKSSRLTKIGEQAFYN